MALIISKNVPKFDPSVINRGDAIRVRRATESTFRNGIVTSINDSTLEILVVNTANQANSFARIDAADVSIGVWEIWWTTDFQTINYNPPAGSGGSGP
jgi:hypothetical protein